MTRLQKLYEELGKSLVGVPLEKRKEEIIREFCQRHELPFGKTKRNSMRISKRMTRKLPQLPFVDSRKRSAARNAKPEAKPTPRFGRKCISINQRTFQQADNREKGYLKMTYEEWCKEFVRLLIERIPEFSPDQANLLADSCYDGSPEGLNPEEALDAEMECWTDDGD